MANREPGPSTRIQVWNRPPLPNESPEPTNRTVTAMPACYAPPRPPPTLIAIDLGLVMVIAVSTSLRAPAPPAQSCLGGGWEGAVTAPSHLATRQSTWLPAMALVIHHVIGPG